MIKFDGRIVQFGFGAVGKSFYEKLRKEIRFNENKYYDIYYGTHFKNIVINSIFNGHLTMLFCTLDTCGGRALLETANWYNDLTYFVGLNAKWNARGGAIYSVNEGKYYAGIFSSFASSDILDAGALRSVLIVS